MLATLERRGYLTRDDRSGRYVLSMALFDLAHRHPPLRGLVQLAAGPMRELADAIRQSCNLGVDDAGAVRIIAQAESPGRLRLPRAGRRALPARTRRPGRCSRGAADDVREPLAGRATAELTHATDAATSRRHDGCRPASPTWSSRSPTAAAPRSRR